MVEPITRNELRINGHTVKLIRKLKSLTQAQVATNACKIAAAQDGRPEAQAKVLDHTTVSYTEKGRQPTEPTMYHIANGLGVDIREITYQAVVYVVEAPSEAVA